MLLRCAGTRRDREAGIINYVTHVGEGTLFRIVLLLDLGQGACSGTRTELTSTTIRITQPALAHLLLCEGAARENHAPT